MVVKEMISTIWKRKRKRKGSETVVNPEAVEYFWRFRDWEGEEEEEEEEVPSKEKSKL